MRCAAYEAEFSNVENVRICMVEYEKSAWSQSSPEGPEYKHVWKELH